MRTKDKSNVRSQLPNRNDLENNKMEFKQTGYRHPKQCSLVHHGFAQHLLKSINRYTEILFIDTHLKSTQHPQ